MAIAAASEDEKTWARKILLFFATCAHSAIRYFYVLKPLLQKPFLVSVRNQDALHTTALQWDTRIRSGHGTATPLPSLVLVVLPEYS